MYNLNINKSSVVPTNLIVGRVLDKPFDTFQFKIFDGLDPLDLTGATLDFRGVTPDNKKVISTDVKIIDAKSGEIEFRLPTNFYSAQGQFRNAYFRINKSGLTESTNDLLINVLNAVDLNLDDSQIIIDQLDKIIEDAINKLDKELANVKLQISQVDGNIKALKKDVEDYKATFKVQMDAMQKQLDNLKNAINRTDIQRPQITKSDGEFNRINDSTKTTIQAIKELGVGMKYIYLQKTKDAPIENLLGISLYKGDQFVSFTGVSMYNSNMTYQMVFDGLGDIKWNRLDGQVQKITRDDGYYKEVKGLDKTTLQAFKELGVGVHFVYIINKLEDTPEPYLKGIVTVSSTSNNDITFIGEAMAGNRGTYSYNGMSNTWKRISGGQYNKITLDDGSPILDINDSTKSLDELINVTDGVYHSYIRQSKNQPEGFLHGIIKKMGNGSLITFTGVSRGGNVYSWYNYGGKSEWSRLDNKGIPNANESNNGLMSSESFKRLNSMWNNRSGVYNLLNQEAYYGVDGFLLDKLTNYEFVDVTAILSGNSVTTRYKVSPDVNFEIPITNVYNDTSSTGFEVWEIQGSINDTRVTVSRSKGVKVGNTTTASNNTSDVKIVGIYGVNKIK